jgi:hypothetical protein
MGRFWQSEDRVTGELRFHYAAMCPSEVRNLRERDLRLPDAGWG